MKYKNMHHKPLVVAKSKLINPATSKITTWNWQDVFKAIETLEKIDRPNLQPNDYNAGKITIHNHGIEIRWDK